VSEPLQFQQELEVSLHMLRKYALGFIKKNLSCLYTALRSNGKDVATSPRWL
jgi:hypothetical protein